MINRIRAIRKQKNLTLADVALACDPPTTAQTIGRLETGTRSLSLAWMNRIGAALGVDPENLVKGEVRGCAQVVARLTGSGAESLAAPRDAILPSELIDGGALLCLAVEVGQGEYRSGDQVWMRRISPEDAASLINRDVLAPRSGGRFAFGRLIDRRGALVTVLPPGIGQRQIVIDRPPWLAVAQMLVRKL